jgi:hypothetical protein
MIIRRKVIHARANDLGNETIEDSKTFVRASSAVS